jgi:hypothetical protein
MSTILVCGGRDFNDVEFLSEHLDHLRDRPDINISMVVQGGAKGADLLAKQWALSRGIHCAQVDAMWDYYQKAAGYRRNSAMLELKPIYAVAFPGGKGTKMMIDLCKKAGITVWEITL